MQGTIEAFSKIWDGKLRCDAGLAAANQNAQFLTMLLLSDVPNVPPEVEESIYKSLNKNHS